MALRRNEGETASSSAREISCCIHPTYGGRVHQSLAVVVWDVRSSESFPPCTLDRTTPHASYYYYPDSSLLMSLLLSIYLASMRLSPLEN